MKKRSHAMVLAALTAVAALSGTRASAMISCDVKETLDGFVALRSSPSLKGRLVARMKAGDSVNSFYPGIDRKGPPDWWKVEWWKRERGKAETGFSHERPNGVGWVYRKLIAEECG